MLGRRDELRDIPGGCGALPLDQQVRTPGVVNHVLVLAAGAAQALRRAVLECTAACWAAQESLQPRPRNIRVAAQVAAPGIDQARPSTPLWARRGCKILSTSGGCCEIRADRRRPLDVGLNPSDPMKLRVDAHTAPGEPESLADPEFVEHVAEPALQLWVVDGPRFRYELQPASHFRHEPLVKRKSSDPFPTRAGSLHVTAFCYTG